MGGRLDRAPCGYTRFDAVRRGPCNAPVSLALSNTQLLIAAWLGVTGLVAFVLFGYDKWQAKRQGARVSEATLWLVCAFGGWPGGLLGLMCFRHKTQKLGFLLEFAAALLVWGTLVSAILKVAATS
jgi:uncharacterized membrane protein YsdA (DUF1294 family)